VGTGLEPERAGRSVGAAAGYACPVYTTRMEGALRRARFEKGLIYLS